MTYIWNYLSKKKIMTYILNFQELNGRNIRVSYANDKPSGPRSFGGGGGYGGGGGGGGYRGDRGFGGGDGVY